MQFLETTEDQATGFIDAALVPVISVGIGTRWREAGGRGGCRMGDEEVLCFHTTMLFTSFLTRETG